MQSQVPSSIACLRTTNTGSINLDGQYGWSELTLGGSLVVTANDGGSISFHGMFTLLLCLLLVESLCNVVSSWLQFDCVLTQKL